MKVSSGGQEYYLGLDMGTSSVGWAVTDMNYRLIKKHGKMLWGIRLFESANTAEARRVFRGARRRIQRQKKRIELLQEIFSGEITKEDPGFYLRMKESKYYPEDKRDQSGATPVLPYALFVDSHFTDKEYHERYPTIYHLRYELMYGQGRKFDVRLVYLALHHIIKHRGHFLFEGKEMSVIQDFVPAFDLFLSYALENGIEISVGENQKQEIQKIMADRKLGRTAKKQAMGKVFGTDRQKKALAALLAGSSVKLADIFGDPSLDEGEQKKISFADSSFDDHINEVEDILQERFPLIATAKAVYDWAVLTDILKDSCCISEAKKKIYDKHREDLRRLKELLRNQSVLFQQVFGVPKKKEANYSAYIGMVKKNGKKIEIEKKCSKQEFYDFLKKVLKPLEGTEDILQEIEMGIFMPKQVVRENGVIPYQLHQYELNQILERAKEYLPFLSETDAEGYSNIDKIKKLFQFKIPYYVGPVNTFHEDQGGNCWAVRQEAGQIYPWNFEKKVDLEKSAEKFIHRMTNKCTYLVGKDVLPKESLLYAKYRVLNELNNLRIDGEIVSVELKQHIYCELFEKKRRVTGKMLKEFLVREGVIHKEQILSGIDQNFKSSLGAYHDLKQILEGTRVSDLDKEDIIKDITLFAESQNMLKKRLKTKFPELTEKQIRCLAEKKYSGWARLSREFLEEMEAVNPKTGKDCNIITALWETNDNLMKLLGHKYFYAEAVEKINEEQMDHSAISYQDVDDLYVSPSVKRPIWQAVQIVNEITRIMHGAPKRIFIEVAREKEKKPSVKNSRRKQLLDLYQSCKKEESGLYAELSQEKDNSLKSDKLFLYYAQLGRCMYSGEAIELEHLYTNRYDIDHIYPQSKVMDDSLDNRVLVKRELNAEKSDSFPVPEQFLQKAGALWRALLQKGLLSKEKYERLTRREEFSDGELAGFIARQIVETRQGTKAAAQLLKIAYPQTEIVYAKASAVSQFRQKFDLIKVRELNDYHHAKDAYLNIVVGNTYHVKFTKDAAWFIENNPGRSYNLNKMFTSERVVRNGETAWIPGNDGSICAIKEALSKNNILFTRRSFEQKGGLFDQQLVKRGKGQIPIKGAGTDSRLMATDKYGAYNKASGAYFMLVESESKKGKRIRSIEYVPVYLAKKLDMDKHSKLVYCEEKLGLKQAHIIIDKIRIDTLLDIEGFKMHVSGRTGSRLLFKGANQLVVSRRFQEVVKKVCKYYNVRNQNRNAVLSEKEELTDEVLLELYEEFQRKLSNTVYKVRLHSQIATLEKGKDRFTGLSKEEKCLVLYEILHLFQCNSIAANLKAIGGPGKGGRLVMSKDISKLNHIYMINQSITGFYEQVIDLKSI